MPFLYLLNLDRISFLGYTSSILAGVAELADAHDSNSCSPGIVGSIPTFGIIKTASAVFFFAYIIIYTFLYGAGMHFRPHTKFLFRLLSILTLSLSPIFSFSLAGVQANASAAPLFAPVPGVSINIPDSLLIGEDFTFYVEFDNTVGNRCGFRSIY